MALPAAGKDILIKVTNDAGSPALVTILGLRTKSIAFNSELIDITHSDSVGLWRTVLDAVSVKSASVSGAGVAQDVAGLEVLRDMKFSGQNRTCNIVIPEFGTVAGSFRCTALELSGEHSSALMFNASLESAGELTFTGV